MPLQKSARVVGVYHAYLTKHFGEGSAEYVKAYLGYDVDRHLRANCRDGLGIDLVSCPSPQAGTWIFCRTCSVPNILLWLQLQSMVVTSQAPRNT